VGVLIYGTIKPAESRGSLQALERNPGKQLRAKEGYMLANEVIE
jgi:hypothetical protein